MKTSIHSRHSIVLAALVVASFALTAGSCGGNGNKADEPNVPLEEGSDQVNWENVQLTKEEEEEFGEGKVEYESKEGSGGTGTGGTDASVGTGSGPGTLKLICKALGDDVVAEIVVKKTSDGSVVEKGDGKSTYIITLPQGIYDVDAIFHGAIDEPKLTLQKVEIAGNTVERTFNFPMALVKFIPVKTGTNSAVSGYKLRLKAMGGEDFYPKSFTPNADYVLISPGNYQGELFKGSKKKEKVIDIPAIQINEGSKATKRIDVSI
jgi:hypothetical protein